jgi:acetylornithine deacetylase
VEAGTTAGAILQAARKEREQTVDFLTGLLRIPSLSGDEAAAMAYLEQRFGETGVVERVALPGDLPTDPEYNAVLPELSYVGRHNLRITPAADAEHGRPSAGNTTRTARLILNAHVDVVPPTSGMQKPWSPVVEELPEAGPVVRGRGACDDKGSIAVLHLLSRMCNAFPEAVACQPQIHLVVEEENGGNGTLAMVRGGVEAEACVVLEPTGLRVVPVVRGAVWFSARFRGEAGHSSWAGGVRSALLNATETVRRLEQYHSELASGHADPALSRLFDRFPNPAPITFGRLVSGSWPSTTPDEALLEGVLGMLPGVSREEVCAGIVERLADLNATVDFPYRHDSSVLAPTHALPALLSRITQEVVADSRRSPAGTHGVGGSADIAGEAGTKLSTTGPAIGLPAPGTIEGLPASCDAWYYSAFAAIPTVVYGPGELAHAHSADEQIAVADIEMAAVALFQFLSRFGSEETP